MTARDTTLDMLTENAEVIRIENDGLWVRSQSVSACQSCRAKSGCGQKLLNRWSGEDFDVFASYPDGFSAQDFSVGETVDISIAPNAVVWGSLLVYGIPLLILVSSISFFDLFFGQHWALFLAVLSGALLISVRVVRAVLERSEARVRFQPTVVGKSLPVSAPEIISFH